MVVTSRIQYHIDRLLADVATAASDGDFPAARVLLNAVLALDPGNEEALRYVEPDSGRIARRRYARHSIGNEGAPLATPGEIRDHCETILRRELTGFMARTPVFWLEAYSVGRTGRKLVYSSGSWKLSKDADRQYNDEVELLIRTLVEQGWQYLPGDPEDLPRFRR